MEKDVVIQLRGGFETRPVAMLVQVASHYPCETFLVTGTKRVNAKSIMGMMTLGLVSGERVTVVTHGEKEAEALAEIEAYLTNAG